MVNKNGGFMDQIRCDEESYLNLEMASKGITRCR